MNYSVLIPVALTVVTGYFAIYQIRLNNITNARLKWLEQLKQLSSDYLADGTIILLKIGVIEGIMKEFKNAPASDTIRDYHQKLNSELFDNIRNVYLKYELIKLHLNSEEELHHEFEELLDSSMRIINGLPVLQDLAKIDKQALIMRKNSELSIKIMRVIMKLEWEKIKWPVYHCLIYLRFGKGKVLKSKIKSDIEKYNTDIKENEQV